MQYPNNIKKETKKYISFSNRGMDLEYLINESNKYYLENDIAVIYKKPTPVKINKISYKNGIPKVDGYLNEKSTLDYVGIYKGKYLDFDAKKTCSKTSFPLSNIHLHQFAHMKKIIAHGGITFLIIEMNDEFYLLEGKIIIEAFESRKVKSISFNDIKQYGHKISVGYNPLLDYLKVIDVLV